MSAAAADVWVDAEAVVAAAAALGSVLAGFDPCSLRGPDCVRVAEALAEVEKSCAAVRLVTAARAVDSMAHQALGFHSGAAWLAVQSGSTLHQAKRDLDVAGQLEDRPVTREAFVRGAISKDQAIEIVEVTAKTPEAERELVNRALSSDLSTLRDRARELRQASVAPDDLHDAQHKARSFRHWRDRQGMVCYAGRATPEVGVPFITRIEQGAAAAKREAQAAGVETLGKMGVLRGRRLRRDCRPQ